MPRRSAKRWERLRDFALTFPAAWEDHPWGEVVVKVNKKIFVFMGDADRESPGIGVKLVDAASHEHALSFDGVEPSAYGLGKSGWVSVPLAAVDDDGLLEDWIEESYRNVATKTLIKQLDLTRGNT